MTIDFENESKITLVSDPMETAREVITGCLDTLGCPYEAQVSLLITDSEQIRQMNSQFRDIDAPTDVLSFPMADFPSPGDFSFLEEDEGTEFFNPESGELVLGDIVINAERVVAQAQEYGHSVLREYAFLITHSVLHLCGYDHMSPEEEQEMTLMQKRILDDLNITRENG